MAGLEWGGGSARVRASVVMLVAIVAVSLSGCGVRLEGDPPVFPSPDDVTIARDSLADAEAGILDAAEREGADADAVAVGAADAAEAHLEVLGGVYVAYPSASPTPDATASAAPQATLAEAITAARETAAAVASTTADADLAFLARSMDLEWALRELWADEGAAAQAEAEAAASATAAPLPSDDAVAGEEPPSDADPRWFPLADGSAVTAAGFAPAAVTGTVSTGLSGDALSGLALKEDEARFAYETLAAQEFGPRRIDALGRSRLHAERSDSFAALIDADPRTPLYQVRDAHLLDPESRRSLERSLETDLAWRYAALLDGASPDDAAWLLNASFDAYARAVRTEGFTEADFPTLPGVEVAARAPSPAPASASLTPSPGGN